MKQLPQSSDANATVAVHPYAWAAYAEAAAQYGEPTSPHRLGRRAKAALEQARAAVAAWLGVAAEEIVFTSGGTESDGLALIGLLAAASDGPRPVLSPPQAAGQKPLGHCVCSRLEHPAVIRTLATLQAMGLEVTFVSADRQGRIRVDEFTAALRADTRLAVLMAASHETGVIQPVGEIAQICRARGIRMHTDAVQMAGKAPLDIQRWGVDTLALAGHKLGAVGGIGVLYVRAGVPLQAVIPGSEEGHRRGGAVNVAGAVSLAAALRALPSAAELQALALRRDNFEARLLAGCADMEILGMSPRLPNTSCVRFPGCAGDALMMALDLAGWAISTGSACASGSIEPSPALLGMGLSPTEARQAVRFSFSPMESAERLQELAELLLGFVKRLRDGS